MSLVNWIDKTLNDFEDDNLFLKYFKGIEIKEIEGLNYLYNPKKGLDIVFSNTLVATTIHLFCDSVNNKKFDGEIPLNLKFSMSKSVVHKVHGIPNKFGGGYKDIFGAVPFWDKYYFDNYSLHLQYSENKDSIEVITIGSLSLESYFNIGLQ